MNTKSDFEAIAKGVPGMVPAAIAKKMDDDLASVRCAGSRTSPRRCWARESHPRRYRI
jgi:hypothetical protein